MKKGYLAFVLHSHLPYVLNHGRWPHGTDWLNEAAAETYIPILEVCEKLIGKGVSPKLTIGISPVLCEQLAHKSFPDEFNLYLNNKIKSAIEDSKEFEKESKPDYLELSLMWQKFYEDTKTKFNDKYQQNLIKQFRLLQDDGQIEIITCGATHGYMPLLSQDVSCQVQIKQAVSSYVRHFGCQPRGIWVPECAYRPAYEWSPPVKVEGLENSYNRKGVEEFLSENGIEYFFVDTATLKGGKAIGAYLDRFDALKELWDKYESQAEPRKEEIEKSQNKIYYIGEKPDKKPVAVFTRDSETSMLVWSGEWGYPGDGKYLDFHKKKFPGGHKYWSVTSPKTDLDDKVIYNKESIDSRLEENSSHFVSIVQKNLENHYSEHGEPGIITAPFDAELLGHWWFEGPGFLQKTIEKIAESEDIGLCTASEYLDNNRPSEVISLPEGSWGEGGHHYIWLNEINEWTWRDIYKDELRMVELAKRYNSADEVERRIIKQAGLELMLLSASDWQFLISTKSARDYAESRLNIHHDSFTKLYDMANNLTSLTEVDLNKLAELEEQDSIFPDFDPLWFEKVEFPL